MDIPSVVELITSKSRTIQILMMMMMMPWRLLALRPGVLFECRRFGQSCVSKLLTAAWVDSTIQRLGDGTVFIFMFIQEEKKENESESETLLLSKNIKKQE